MSYLTPPLDKRLAVQQPFRFPIRLAIEQDFCPHIETNAREKLVEAKTAFDSGLHTKSANLFLESWRILRDEYESNIYNPKHILPLDGGLKLQEEVVQQSKSILHLSFVALHDLAQVCYRNLEGYKDYEGNCNLKVHASSYYGWKGNTTTESIITEGDKGKKTWAEGSSITQVLLLKDPLGQALDRADSFQDAALIVFRFCSHYGGSVSSSLNDQGGIFNFIVNSLRWIRIERHYEALRVFANRNSYNVDNDEKEERTKMIELVAKGGSLTIEDEEELMYLITESHSVFKTPRGYKHTSEGSLNMEDEKEEYRPIFRMSRQESELISNGYSLNTGDKGESHSVFK